eukprot:1253255-Alexandrium_andersonii.AAC.1
MSASLVGSEMCIRDRRNDACSTTPALQMNTRSQQQRRTHAQRAPSAQPVSYTHLTLPTICSV